MPRQDNPAVIADLKASDLVRFTDRFGRAVSGHLVEISGYLLTTPIWKIDTERQGTARFVSCLLGDIIERCPSRGLW